MPSSDIRKTEFWVLLSIAIVIIVIAIIIVIVASVYFTTYKDALQGAVLNQNACASHPTRCNYFNINPPLPTQFPDAFSSQIALFCAQQILSIEDYSKTNNLNIPVGLTLEGIIKTQEKDAPLFAYVGLDKLNRTLYLFIRGTETAIEWGFDFTISQKPQNVLYTLPQSEWQCSSETLVHSGFLELFLQIQPQIHKLISENLTYCDKVVISGHSLGAALSSLSAIYVSSNLTSKPVFVYTFGKPRVGNVAYSQCIAVHFPNRFWRIENNDDIVIQLPLSATPNLSNYNFPYLYEHEGTPIGFSTNWGSLQLNHSMNNYMQHFIE